MLQRSMILIQTANKNGVLIVDYKTPKEETNILKSFGFEIIKTSPNKAMYDAIDGHPDIQMTLIGNTLFVNQKIPYEFLVSLENKNIHYKIGKKSLSLPYPSNIPFNSLVSDDLFIHKLDSTEPLVLEKANKLNLDLINVNQGYTRCSTAFVGKDSYITEDKSIAKKLASLNKNVFIKEPSNIYLRGFDHGFIGGSMSLITLNNENIILITGDIDKYRFGNDLKSFLNNINIPYLSIGKGLVKDRGSVIQVKSEQDF